MKHAVFSSATITHGNNWLTSFLLSIETSRLLKVNIISPTLTSHEFTFPSQEEARVEASGSGSQNMDRLVDLLNSMRSNSSGVEQQLASFMEEAQCSARSEESLTQVVRTIYCKAVSDRSFAATAAKLCDKMALFMVEGTKFRSLLLNMLQVRARATVVIVFKDRLDAGLKKKNNTLKVLKFILVFTFLVCTLMVDIVIRFG